MDITHPQKHIYIFNTYSIYNNKKRERKEGTKIQERKGGGREGRGRSGRGEEEGVEKKKKEEEEVEGGEKASN